MDMKKRRDMQIAYVADDAVMEEMAECRKKLFHDEEIDDEAWNMICAQ